MNSEGSQRKHGRIATSDDVITRRYVELVTGLRDEFVTEHGDGYGWERAVASRLGIHETHLSRILHHNFAVNWPAAKRAAQACGLPLGYFTSDVANAPEAPDVVEAVERFRVASGGGRGWKSRLPKQARTSPSHLSKILGGKPVGPDVLGRIVSASNGAAGPDDDVLEGLAIDAIRAGRFGLAIKLLGLAMDGK